MKTFSPLRYPGGKTVIRLLVSDILKTNNFCKSFVEVYAGGAGLGLWLLANNKIDRLVLNDVDDFIFAFWDSVLNHPDELIKLIKFTPVTVDEWFKQRFIIQDKEVNKNYSRLQIGFAALFLNRCNRSGIIRSDVGPIGGKSQKSNWKIDVRFNKENIVAKIMDITKRRKRIKLLHLDSKECITSLQNDKSLSQKYFYYLDPPYYKNGDSLYRTFYKLDDHIALHNYLSVEKNLQWVLSYDSADYIKTLYSNFEIHEININHHAHKSKNGTELLITPFTVTWPT